MAASPGLFAPVHGSVGGGAFLDLRHYLKQNDHAHVRSAGSLCGVRICFEDLRTEDQKSESWRDRYLHSIDTERATERSLRQKQWVAKLQIKALFIPNCPN